MNVRDILVNDNFSDFINECVIVNLSGWLVIIDSCLFLLDEDLAPSYLETEKIQIKNVEISFAIRDCISPLGGGNSFVFHRAIINGALTCTDSLKIDVVRLLIQDNEKSKYMEVDLSPEAIERAKAKYGDHLLRPLQIDSDDWLDFV